MTTIGLIGSGNIGSTLARLAVGAGYDVVVSNSRGPQTLGGLVEELGPRARAGTAAEAAAAGDLVVVTVPLGAYEQVPVEPLAGTTVLDTTNYYPERDGRIPALDDGTATTSGLLQQHLPRSRVVKAFNTIYHVALAQLARPHGDEQRTTLPVYGDDETGTREAVAFLDAIGYDALVAGGLGESWRAENGRPAYVVPYATDGDPERPAPAGAEVVADLLARAERTAS